MTNFKNKVVTHITLPTDAPMRGAPLQVYAKKNDANSRYLVVRIVDASGNINVEGNAQLNATRPDGKPIFIGATTNDDGTVAIPLKSSLLAVDGKISCDVTVFDKEDNEAVILTTTTFYILVDDSNYDADAVEGKDEFSISAEVLAQIGEDRRVAEQARDEAERAKETASEAAANAENSETTAADACKRAENAKDIAVQIQETLKSVGYDSIIDEQKKIVSKIGFIKNDMRTFQQQQRQMEIRIANVEALGGSVQTITEKVTGKSRVEVSENALPYATVDAIFGNFSMDSVNVLPYDVYNGSYQSFFGSRSISRGGLDFTCDHLGRMTVSSGSAREKIDFWLFDSSFGFKPINGVYIGSGCPAGGSNSTYRLRFIVTYNDGKKQSTFYDYGDGRGAINASDGSNEIVIDDTVKCVTVAFQVFAGAYLGYPREVLPQLQPGTTVTEWEPYQYKLTFADLSAIESYGADGNLVDTFEVPDKIRNLPDYGVNCGYHFSLWDRYPEHCSLYGYGNAVDLVNKKYYRVAGVTDWFEGLYIPNAGDNGVTDGIKFANGGGSMDEADISEYITDNYIKVSAGGYLVLKTNTGVPCSIYLTYQKRVENEVAETPFIGENGNWWIGDTDTGEKAAGEDGYTPRKGIDYYTEAETTEMVQRVLNALPNGDEVSY